MAKCLLSFALCLITASALAQAPRDEGSGNENGGRRMRRGQESGQPGEETPSGRTRGRGAEGERGGPDSGRGGPGGFRRPNPMFEALDADGDGEINAAELKKAIVALKKLDADGDGRITLAEVTPQGGPGGMFGGDPAQMVDRMFEQSDKDGDGMISKEEMPDGYGARMLENADKDGDGKVSKEEATTAMEDTRNHFRGGPGGGGPGNPGGGGGADNPQAMIQKYDKNGDGKLSAQEVPEQMKRMLQGGDANNDGLIDQAELAAVGQRMAERMRGGPGGYGRGRGNDQGGEQGQGARPGRGARPEPQK